MRKAERDRARQPLSTSGRHRQLIDAVRYLMSLEEDPELAKLLEDAWQVADDYEQLRKAVARFKQARQKALRVQDLQH